MEEQTEAMPKLGESEAASGGLESHEGPEEAQNDMDASGDKDASPASNRRKIIAVVAGAIVVALLAVGAVAFATGQPASQSSESEPVEAEEAAPVADEPREVAATINVEISGTVQMTEQGMTPVIAHVKGESDAVKDVDFYTALDRYSVIDDGAMNSEKILILEGERYAVEYIDSITPNGGILHVTELDGVNSTKLGAVNSDDESGATEGGYDSILHAGSEIIPAKDVTQKQIDEIMEKLKGAVANGDGSLAGEKGQAILDAAAKNAAANESLDGADETAKPDEGASTEADSGAGRQAGSQAGGSPSGAASQTPSSATASEPEPSKPQHQHSWVDVTRTETYVITPEQTTSVDYLIAENGRKFYDIGDGESYCIVNDLSYSIYTETKTTAPAVTGTREVFDHTECSTCGAWQ